MSKATWPFTMVIKGTLAEVPGYEFVCVDVSGSRIARVHVREKSEQSGEDEGSGSSSGRNGKRL